MLTNILKVLVKQLNKSNFTIKIIENCIFKYLKIKIYFSNGKYFNFDFLNKYFKNVNFLSFVNVNLCFSIN